MAGVQGYPRNGEGFLNDSELKPHIYKIDKEELKHVVVESIRKANAKSGRAILEIHDEMTEEHLQKLYKKSGFELFKYFSQYCGDPAATAHQCYGRHYSDVAKEAFRNRTLQMERMNSGWRYQFIAKDTAAKSKRFDAVSDIGQTEADFNVTIGYRERSNHLTIYVSVKNRENTMGGQDWPKAITALENVAINDRNRTGSYICVFGIAMQKGKRRIKTNQKIGQPYSINTEIWRSDFFWPFFSNYSYEEIMKVVLETLIETQKIESIDLPIPDELIEAFGEYCCKHKLLNDKGCFCDPYKLVELFCGVVK